MDIHDWLMLAPESEWIFRGLIAQQSLNMFKSPREVGKSRLACDGIASYAKGEPDWLGGAYEGDQERGNVYYMVTDANAEAEVSVLLAQLGVPRGRVQLGRYGGELRKSGIEDWVRWGAWLQGVQGVSILVVDNGTGMTDGVVDTEESARLFKRLRAMTGPMGLTVILIHHEKNSGGTAGNYSWESETRWRLRLSCPSGDPRHDPYRELIVDGGNVSEAGDIRERIPLRMPRKSHPGSRFTLTDLRNATPEKRSKEREEDHGDKFKALVAMERTWKTQEEMADAIGISPSGLRRILGEKGYSRDRKTGLLVPVGK